MTGSTTSPDGVSGWIEDARQLLIQRKGPEALEVLDRNLAEQADVALGWALRTWALVLTEKYQDALESANRSIVIDPNCPQAWNEKAGALERLGRYGEAVACMNKHFELTQDHELCSDQANSCWATKADLEHLAGDFKATIESCKKAFEAKVLTKFTNHRMGASLVELGKHSEAVPYLEAQMESTLTDEYVQQYFVRALLKTEKYHSVVAECDDALARNRRCGWALAYRGDAYLKLQDYDAAIKDFTHALELDRSLTWVNDRKDKAKAGLQNRRWKEFAIGVAKVGIEVGVKIVAEQIRERNAKASLRPPVIEGGKLPIVDQRLLKPPQEP